jgi:hypothetical protein
VSTVSVEQIAKFAADAGFKGVNLQVAVAVSCAEDPSHELTAHNTKGEDSRGLWQINVARNANPDLAGMNLFDGATNARAAKIVHDRQGWTAWSVFKNQSYLLYMPRAGLAISREPSISLAESDVVAGAVSTSSVGQAVGTVAEAGGAIQQVGDLAARAGTFLANPRSWIRIVYVAVGAALVVAALMIVARPVVEPAAKAVADIAV